MCKRDVFLGNGSRSYRLAKTREICTRRSGDASERLRSRFPARWLVCALLFRCFPVLASTGIYIYIYILYTSCAPGGPGILVEVSFLESREILEVRDV